MFYVLAGIAVVFYFGAFTLRVYEYNRKPDARKLFIGKKNNVININEMVFFSRNTVARSIKNHLDKNEVPYLIFSNMSDITVIIKKESSLETIIETIERIQNSRNNIIAEDYIMELLVDIWCENSQYNDYRERLEGILLSKYDEGEISKHSYNEIASAFYNHIIF